VAEGNGLLNRHTSQIVSRVRIPLSPPGKKPAHLCGLFTLCPIFLNNHLTHTSTSIPTPAFSFATENNDVVFMGYHSHSDQDLLAECSQDNIKAFNALFDRYSGKLYNYALNYIKDEFFAEEAMMDVMLWIWNNRHTLKVNGDFKHYIFRAVKNATIKSIRKQAITLLPVEHIENDQRFLSEPADLMIKTGELQLSYLDGLQQLSPQRRLVFTMSREENLSHAEIARDLDLSVNTVKNHMKAALGQFKKHFDNDTEAASTMLVLLVLLSNVS
jgi:RNA polymerase sigma-70 factor (family 1)